MQAHFVRGSSVIMRCCLSLVLGLTVTGCALSDEPIPAGPIETGPLLGDLTAAATGSPLPPTESTPEPAQVIHTAPQSSGMVSGSVDNGTDDAPVPADLSVELRGVKVDGAGSITEFLARTAQIDADRSFFFKDVPLDVPSSAYIVRAIYDGVEFTNGTIVDPAVLSIELPLVIYENTTDPSVITVDAMHLLIRRHPDALLVAQVMVFSNASDRVYVSPEPVAGGRRGSVVVPVPADAYGLSFEEGELGGRFVVAVDGLVYDTRQVIPGQESHVVTASYIVPFGGPGQVSLPITYPTRAVNVLVEEGMQVSSPDLVDGGSLVVQEQAIHKYLARDIAAGQSLDVHLIPAGGWVDTLRVILAVLIVLLVLVSVLYWLLIARRGSGKAVSAQPSEEHQRLARQIAALDEALRAGKFNRFEWEAQRAEIEAQMAETDYLLATPANAAHLRQSIAETQAGSYEEQELLDI